MEWRKNAREVGAVLLAALLLFTQPLPEDAGMWRVRVHYDFLGVLPCTAEGAVFTVLGG